MSLVDQVDDVEEHDVRVDVVGEVHDAHPAGVALEQGDEPVPDHRLRGDHGDLQRLPDHV